MAHQRSKPTSRAALVFVYLCSVLLVPLGGFTFFFVYGMIIHLNPSLPMGWFTWTAVLALIAMGLVMTFAPILVYLLERSDRG